MLSLIALAAGAFAFLFFFSVTERTFACSGTIEKGVNKRSATIYLRLDQYAWWVRLWSDSDGHLVVEMDDRLLINFARLQQLRSVLHIHSRSNDLKLAGSLSTMSGKLLLDTGFESFDGICREQTGAGK